SGANLLLTEFRSHDFLHLNRLFVLFTSFLANRVARGSGFRACTYRPCDENWTSMAILADPAKRGGARPRCHLAMPSSSTRRATRRGMAGALIRTRARTNLFLPNRRLATLVIPSGARKLLL